MNDPEACLRRFAGTAESLHGELTALDQVSGDGDFGDNLRDALLSVIAALDAMPSKARVNAFTVAGELFLDTVGGTSGPLLGLLFQAMGRSLQDVRRPVEANIAIGVREGLAAIQRVGEAIPGDRTMVDALVPAADALLAGSDAGTAADAAYCGARKTARLRARLGRASYVGNRAMGSPDPGAVGVALLFRSLAEDNEWEAGWSLSELVATTPGEARRP